MGTQEIAELLADSATRERGFAAMVDAFTEPLYWHIRRMVVVHEDAEDLLQEVWIRALRGITSLHGGGEALRPWLYAIATNLCLTRLRRKYMWRMVALEDVGPRLAERFEATVDMPADAIEAKFQRALLTLPTKQRLVFNLRYYDELPYAEISRITGLDEGTLKTNYHHARKRIQKLMTP